MLGRPHNLQSVSTSILFNFNYYDCCEIDLEHVNKNKRSHFSIEDVADIVHSKLNGLKLEPSDTKFFLNTACEYFVVRLIYENKRFKLVFCICTDKPSTIGVITLFRI